ncbi:hypothetical protein LR48_Vigan347s001900 [Vigna angularis]|uniref:Uncharacterized protein n=1 Tax=Phaseolus angularis TaxID=3914 RepID=A0A0L9T8P1_PHAAN|nr:hypothetical protein LR48_Vigan347s001900 [Vigna angularis]
MEDTQNQGCHRRCSEHPEGTAWFEFHMELPSESEPFQLEQAVCSHGFFMMAPNRWDPLSKTLTRSLLLHNPSSSSSSLLVSMSQRSQSLAVRVHVVHSISPQQQRHITVLNSVRSRFFSRCSFLIRFFCCGCRLGFPECCGCERGVWGWGW